MCRKESQISLASDIIKMWASELQKEMSRRLDLCESRRNESRESQNGYRKWDKTQMGKISRVREE